MEAKDRNDELMELKDQMELLKKQLHKHEIVKEGQIAEIARTYKPKHPYWRAALGVVLGLTICATWVEKLIFHFDELPLWEIVLGGVLILITVFFYGVSYAGNSYEIKDGRLVLRNVLKQKTLDIPIDKIRFVEFMAYKGRGARIMYNKFDDFYLRGVNYTELIKDILKVNPDIEIRRELA